MLYKRTRPFCTPFKAHMARGWHHIMQPTAAIAIGITGIAPPPQASSLVASRCIGCTADCERHASRLHGWAAAQCTRQLLHSLFAACKCTYEQLRQGRQLKEELQAYCITSQLNALPILPGNLFSFQSIIQSFKRAVEALKMSRQQKECGKQQNDYTNL